MNTFNVDGKKFTALLNSSHGQVNQETIFTYKQRGEYIWATYHGGEIRIGTLSGKFVSHNVMHFHYGHWDVEDEYRSGTCRSTLSRQEDGRIRIQEDWVWNDDSKRGNSLLIEID